MRLEKIIELLEKQLQVYNHRTGGPIDIIGKDDLSTFKHSGETIDFFSNLARKFSRSNAGEEKLREIFRYIQKFDVIFNDSTLRKIDDINYKKLLVSLLIGRQIQQAMFKVSSSERGVIIEKLIASLLGKNFESIGDEMRSVDIKGTEENYTIKTTINNKVQLNLNSIIKDNSKSKYQYDMKSLSIDYDRVRSTAATAAKATSWEKFIKSKLDINNLSLLVIRIPGNNNINIYKSKEIIWHKIVQHLEKGNLSNVATIDLNDKSFERITFITNIKQTLNNIENLLQTSTANKTKEIVSNIYSMMVSAQKINEDTEDILYNYKSGLKKEKITENFFNKKQEAIEQNISVIKYGLNEMSKDVGFFS